MEKRKQIFTKINDLEYSIDGKDAFLPLAQFLRQKLNMCGTKIVCSEGDCGACTVLFGREVDRNGKLIYKAVNSCILPVYLLDGAHVITIEGIKENGELNEIQNKMVECNGTQCGYCTPGFIMSMSQMADKCKKENKEITEKRAQNFLTGNLCRCTGYAPIVEAATKIDLLAYNELSERYYDADFIKKIKNIKSESLVIAGDEHNIILPSSLEEALLLKEIEPKLKLVAGNTDLGVLLNKGKASFNDVMSLIHVKELSQISVKDGFISVGATVTLSQFEDFIEDKIPSFKNLLHIFASPQIKNQGTIIGNVLNASPIGDTIPFLMVMDCKVVIDSTSGERIVDLKDFYLGYKSLNLRQNEIVTKIIIPILQKDEHLKLYKVSLRKDLDISATSFAGLISIDNNKIKKIKIAYGGVGPVVTRVFAIENMLKEKEFSFELFQSAALELKKHINPISDLRASREYRLMLSKNFLLKFFNELKEIV
jgi:xanthine dehydrogenase small subunit